MSALAKIVARSKRERESWKYTDVEKILSASSPYASEARNNSLPLVGRVREGGDKPDLAVQYPALSRQASPPHPQPLPRGEGSFAQLVFADGVWKPEQSRLGDLPKGILQGDAASGYRLKLEGQTCLVTQPVELLFVSSGAGETAMKLHVELGANGRLTLIEKHTALPLVGRDREGGGKLGELVQTLDLHTKPHSPPPDLSHEGGGDVSVHVMETEITLHPQAKLVHGKAVRGGEASAHLALAKVKVAEGAYYDNFTLIKGGRLTRNEIDVRLEGKLAQCALNGAMLLRGREHADTTTRITHAAPDGSSRQVYKTVLGDRARGVFQGKIIVAEGAQKTDGYQLSRALLLSDQAEMDAKPELEIYADDVKCSHGSAVGDLDADALFYLRARGLSEEQARGLLIRAFVDEIVDDIRVPEWRDFCRAEVEGWLDEQT